MLLALLAERPGRHVIGVDMSHAQLAAARQRVGAAVQLIEANCRELPLQDACVDAVTSHMTLMLMEQIEDVLRAARRVLRPGSMFSAVVQGPAEKSRAQVLILESIRERTRAEGVALQLGDRRCLSPEGLRELLAKGWSEPLLQPFVLSVEVPYAESAAFLERAYYPVDLLSPQSKSELAALLRSRQSEFAPDGVLRWRFGMRLVTASRLE